MMEVAQDKGSYTPIHDVYFVYHTPYLFGEMILNLLRHTAVPYALYNTYKHPFRLFRPDLVDGLY